MGYRSHVMALIYPDVEDQESARAKYEQLKLLMATTFKPTEDEFSGYMTWMDADCVLKFEMQGVKWYDSYPGVQDFTRMMEAFDADSAEPIEGYCTEFVRVGEDSDDAYENHTGENNRYHLGLSRSISCDV